MRKLTNREIGLRLKESRNAKGYTLQQVAELVGVDRSTIQRYETGGIVVIKRPVIESICACLSVNPKWILGESENRQAIGNSELPDDILFLSKRLLCIPQNQRKKLMEALNSTIDLYEQLDK
ncbi:MAG: helix-turn-helix domain-containing protein [Clostridia bacterium]|nr:helix-turn-helix domain-containing protein [Clostridia bacterium]